MRNHCRRSGKRLLVQSAGDVVLDEHMRFADQFAHDVLALGLPEVHAHAPLVPVQRHEVQAHRGPAADVHERRPETPAVVADRGPLDLDHVRAHVGQDHGAVRPRGHPGHVDHPDALQRPGAPAGRAAAAVPAAQHPTEQHFSRFCSAATLRPDDLRPDALMCQTSGGFGFRSMKKKKIIKIRINM